MDSPKNLFSLKLILVFFLNPTASGEYEDKLALAGLLIKNGNLNKAESVLKGVQDPNDVRTDRYYTLLGLLAFKQKRHANAVTHLLNAQKSGVAKRDLIAFRELLARVYLNVKEYSKANEILESHKGMQTRPAYHQLKAKLHFDQNSPNEGWAALHRGIKKFPRFLPLKKQKWFYLFNNNLIEQSRLHLLEMVRQIDVDALELARMAHRYRLKKEFKTAIAVGEMARLKNPAHPEIVKELARSYIETGNVLAAADLFHHLAVHHPKFYPEASDLRLKSGYPKMAERLALKIPDADKSLKQHIAISVETKNYGRVARLAGRISRSGLKTDQNIQYALAFSHFRLGEFNKVEKFLKNISRPDLFAKATAVRKAIRRCSENPGVCL